MHWTENTRVSITPQGRRALTLARKAAAESNADKTECDGCDGVTCTCPPVGNTLFLIADTVSDFLRGERQDNRAN